MNLTKMIFDYWKHWLLLDNKDIEYVHKHFSEGISSYYDGYNATFWYLLNVRWYEMNDKHHAKTGCIEKYEILRDFDEEYLLENGYK